jgi:hypothetical protein
MAWESKPVIEVDCTLCGAEVEVRLDPLRVASIDSQVDEVLVSLGWEPKGGPHANSELCPACKKSNSHIAQWRLI